MTTPETEFEITTSPASSRPARVSLWRTVLKNPLGLGASIVLALIVLLSLIGPFIAPYDPNDVRIELINAPAGGDYLLGGDGSGRDILSRLLYGGRSTLSNGLLAVVIALVLGTVTGLLAGYFGKTFDTVSSWIAYMFQALPALMILLAFYQPLGGSVLAMMAVFGVLLAPGFFRLVRNLVIAVKGELYVDAARVAGLSDTRIIGRHVLGVIRSPIIIQTAIIAGVAIIVQSGLAFIIGDSRTPSWGGSLADAFTNIYVTPTSVLWPGLLIALTVGSLALLGGAIRDSLQGSRVAGVPKRTRPAAPPPSPNGPQLDADTLLNIDDLHVGYGPDGKTVEVVEGVSFAVRRGEILGIVGESGSGKTQTAFSVLGLLPRGGRVLSGSIRFDGTELTTLGSEEMASLRGGSIAYVPQEPMSNLDPAFRMGAQLVEPMRTVLRISRAEAKRRALHLLERVGIPDPQRTFDAYPHEISGGMAQRVLIAAAVSCHPTLLIADEPTTALDVTVQAEVLELIRELQDEVGMAVMLVTHNFGVVADICDRVVVMQNGQVVESNDVEPLFDNPQDSYTQMLLNSTLDDAAPRGDLVPHGGA